MLVVGGHKGGFCDGIGHKNDALLNVGFRDYNPRNDRPLRSAVECANTPDEQRQTMQACPDFVHTSYSRDVDVVDCDRLDKRHVYALRVHGKPSSRDGSPREGLRAHWLHESSNPGVEPNKYFAANGHPYGQIEGLSGEHKLSEERA